MKELDGLRKAHEPHAPQYSLTELALIKRLSPHLLRVAEAAEATQAIVDIIIWDEQARCRNCGCDRPDHNINCDIPDLPAALAALKEAAGGGA